MFLDPTALLEYGVTLQEVEQALQQSNINTSGGFAIKGETERSIRVLGRLESVSHEVLEDLRKIPIKMNEDRPVLLGQVARVVAGPEFKRGDGAINGHPGVVLTIVKQPHVDTRALTNQVGAAFQQVEDSLPADIVINSNLFQLKNFIDRAIFNVGEALVLGATLVVIVLFLFLLNFRTTFITLAAIPMSLVITTLVFRVISHLTGTPLSIFVVLMILFPSVRIVLQILNALPTAFIGGVLALVITQQSLTVASLVGFISLGGIAVRNGILLVTHYFHLMREEGEEFSQHMILRGSLERLAPVLMTALTAGIALIPFARRTRAGPGNFVSRRHRDSWGLDYLHVLRVPNSPRTILEV